MTPKQICLTIAVLSMLMLAGGCGTAGARGASTCKGLLDAGYADLDRAKAKGLGDAGDVIKAASLLSAASVQRQFNKYPNCIDKAQRARALLRPLL